MSLDDTKRECQRLATVEVVRFMELQVHPPQGHGARDVARAPQSLS